MFFVFWCHPSTVRSRETVKSAQGPPPSSALGLILRKDILGHGVSVADYVTDYNRTGVCMYSIFIYTENEELHELIEWVLESTHPPRKTTEKHVCT